MIKCFSIILAPKQAEIDDQHEKMRLKDELRAAKEKISKYEPNENPIDN